MKNTIIPNPFDAADVDEQATVQAKISQKFEHELFTKLFPNRGNRSNITAQLLDIFFLACTHEQLEEYSERNEAKALAILKKFENAATNN